MQKVIAFALENYALFLRQFVYLYSEVIILQLNSENNLISRIINIVPLSNNNTSNILLTKLLLGAEHCCPFHVLTHLISLLVFQLGKAGLRPRKSGCRLPSPPGVNFS